MCDCQKHHADAAECTCVCEEHGNFTLALELAFARYDEIVRLCARITELEADR